jgi:hypothetical protein
MSKLETIDEVSLSSDQGKTWSPVARGSRSSTTVSAHSASSAMHNYVGSSSPVPFRSESLGVTQAAVVETSTQNPSFYFNPENKLLLGKFHEIPSNFANAIMPFVVQFDI